MTIYLKFIKSLKLFQFLQHPTNLASKKHFKSNNIIRLHHPSIMRGRNLELVKRSLFKLAIILPQGSANCKNENYSSRKVDKCMTLLEVTIEVIMVVVRIILITSVVSAMFILYWITRFTHASIFPNMLLKAMEFLGPTFIKFGQWISTRKDLFPYEVCNVLSRLQHNTPAHSWMYTRNLLKATYGQNWKALFVKFDSEEPIGSGCCAQVYKAWINYSARERIMQEPQVSCFVEIAEFLHLSIFLDKMFGKSDDIEKIELYPRKLYPVAVKVLHPGVERQLRRDLVIMRALSECVTFIIPGLRWLSLVDCVKEFSELMKSQVAMDMEASNLLKFSKNFSMKNNVIFPYPYMELTNHGILVESFHEGSPISEYLDHSNRDLQQKLAKIGITTIFKMVFEDNFVHCDLHPGNILVQEFSECESGLLALIWKIVKFNFQNSPRLVILDCGMAASLNERCRRNIRDVFRSVAKGDGELAGEYIMRHSVHVISDPAGFKTTVGRIVRTHLQDRIGLDNLNVSTIVAELFSAMIRYQVKQDGSFSSVILSMAVIEGLGRSLDPKINIVTEVAPFVLGASLRDGFIEV